VRSDAAEANQLDAWIRRRIGELLEIGAEAPKLVTPLTATNLNGARW
jgi:hypothetical protein